MIERLPVDWKRQAVRGMAAIRDAGRLEQFYRDLRRECEEAGVVCGQMEAYRIHRNATGAVQQAARTASRVFEFDEAEALELAIDELSPDMQRLIAYDLMQWHVGELALESTPEADAAEMPDAAAAIARTIARDRARRRSG